MYFLTICHNMFCQKQGEGMGLLEYQAIPSLRDVAHDGWLCTFTKYQQLKNQLGSPSYWCVTEKAGGTARPTRTQSHLPGHFPPASQPGRRVGPAL